MRCRFASRSARRVGGPFLLALLCLGAPRLLGAQRVEGTVRDSMSGAPIPGAVVTFTDGAGHVLRQLLTDTAGRFATAAPLQTARVRVLRIGFHPVERAVSPEGGGTVTLDLRMSGVVILLPAVRTASEKICGDRNAGGGAALELWQQARAGLLASVVARKSYPATVRVLGYRQVFDADGNRLLQQRSWLTTGIEQRAFGAAETAGDFERTGFVVDANASRTFYAPDADVLLDPRFAATHCFSVALDRIHHPDDVGLAFEPARNASHNVVDVAGTLWLHSGTPQLRSLDFHYVGIEPAAAAANAGGAITFTTMANGVVVLSRWSLVAPMLVRRETYEGRASVWRDHVAQVDHIGGILADASWPDGVHWHGPVGTLVGRVVRGAFVLPARGVSVWLPATGDTVTTDADGGFRFYDLLPGHYTVHADDPALDLFHAEPPVQADVDVPDRVDTMPPLSLLSYEDIERRICQGEPVDSGTTVMLGRLSSNGAAPDWTTDLRLTWPAARTAEGARTRVSRGARGRFYVCNLPRRRLLSVRALHGTTVVLDTVVGLPDAPVTIETFPLAPRGTASATGTIIGFARDSAGAPVPDVEVIVGRDVIVHTDSLGNFVVPAVRPGTTLVRARRLGFGAVAMAAAVPANGAASLSLLVRRVVVLPTVTTTAEGTTAMPNNRLHTMDLFYQRRAQAELSGAGGEFFTQADIERRHAMKLSDLLEGQAAHLPQCRNAGNGAGTSYELFINDLHYSMRGDGGWKDLLDAIPPSWVAGVEVYTSPIQLPVEAVGNACAAIFVWLK